MFLFYFLQSRETALHIAVKSKNIEMVKLLLDHGASCENVDRVSRHCIISCRGLCLKYLKKNLKCGGLV